MSLEFEWNKGAIKIKSESTYSRKCFVIFFANTDPLRYKASKSLLFTKDPSIEKERTLVDEVNRVLF